MYESGASTPTEAFHDVGWMALQFHHVAIDPPGSSESRKPFGGLEDNNVVTLVIRSADDDVGFSGAVSSRLFSYANLRSGCRTSCCDSGAGVAPVGVSSPPVPCL